jgi:hypothetical protein
VLGEPAEVVPPHHQHRATEQSVVEHRQQRVDECGALTLLCAGRPQLLELVDHQRDRAAVGAGPAVTCLGVGAGVRTLAGLRTALDIRAAEQRGQFIDRSRPGLDDHDLCTDAVRHAAAQQFGHQPGPDD